GEARRRQLEQLARSGEAGIERELGRLLPAAQRLEPRARLPLVDLALPALGALSQEQYRVFDANLRALVAADERIELFEFVLQRVVRAHLQPRFERATPPRIRHASLRALREPCSVVLSSLAYAGSLLDDWVRAAFERGAAQLSEVGVALLPRERAGLRDLDRALRQLAEVAPGAREPLLRACAACIASDREVSQGEGELLRGIAASLGCPMPPLLPGQSLW
ncbi:MAG TPA: Zn-dependent protease with chaperone function, partial [Myxococcota bacterium]|nr:Zn-dependent protease with chaperone function [Myxococcota bacterium]